jgi:hypothetical protein
MGLHSGVGPSCNGEDLAPRSPHGLPARDGAALARLSRSSKERIDPD